MTPFDLDKIDPRSPNLHQEEILCKPTRPLRWVGETSTFRVFSLSVSNGTEYASSRARNSQTPSSARYNVTAHSLCVLRSYHQLKNREPISWLLPNWTRRSGWGAGQLPTDGGRRIPVSRRISKRIKPETSGKRHEIQADNIYNFYEGNFQVRSQITQQGQKGQNSSAGSLKSSGNCSPSEFFLLV